MPKVDPAWRTKWPDEVELPDVVGKHKFYIDNKPHCAIGYLQLVLPRGCDEEKEWRRQYRVGAEHVLKLDPAPAMFLSSSCERMNDDFTQDEYQRALLYAVAWGLCGYDLWDEKGKTWTEPTRIVAAILKGKEPT